jgi:outer membrane lipoprotein-sorting protein
MIRSLLFAVLFAIPLFCAAASAQTSSAPTVDEVINKHIAARGGLDKMKAISTVRMSGTATIGPGIQAPVVLQLKRPGEVRMEITVQGKALVQATDGKTAWTISPFEGSSDPQTVSAEDAKDLDEQADFDGPLVDYKAKGHSVELIGKEDFEGSPVYKVKLTLKGGDVQYIYIDADSFLELKETTKRTQQGKEIELESYPSNYKAIGGVLFPHAIETKANGQPAFQVTLDKIEVNTPIEDTAFKMPSKP